jgi:hypothetical protein
LGFIQRACDALGKRKTAMAISALTIRDFMVALSILVLLLPGYFGCFVAWLCRGLAAKMAVVVAAAHTAVHRGGCMSLGAVMPPVVSL